MKTLAILALVVSLLFLFGCPGTEPEKPVAQTPQNVNVNVQEPAPVAPEPENSTPPSQVQNGTNGTAANGMGNNTTTGIVELPTYNEHVFSGIPRNVSDNISDGEFDILDFRLEPLKVKVLNCGNGDCVFVNKGLFYMLVDAGEAQPVIDEMDSRGIDRLNVVVATRDDPLAIRGISSIINSYTVDEFWYNGIDTGSAEWKSLLSLVKERGIAVKRPVVGDRMDVSGLGITVLNPQKQKMLSNPDNDAIVLKLSNKNFCMVLLNPTVQERENALITGSESLKCPVVTYYRQGMGRPDPSLLLKFYIQPKNAIISVGTGIAGLPSNTTLTRLAGDGVAVWRTDTQGAISVVSDLTGEYVISANATG